MNIQNLLDYDVTKTENMMEIRTDFINPSDSNSGQKRYRFKLDPIGFLSGNTMFTYKIVNNTGSGSDPRLNPFNGALGGIERITLSIGDRNLIDFEGVNDWSTLHNLYKLDRDTLNGYYTHFIQNQFVSKNNETNYDLDYDNKKSGYDYSIPAPNKPTENSFKIHQNKDESWLIGVPLSLICPPLKDRELPLFLFNQYNIYITVYYSNPNLYIVNNDRTKECFPETTDNYSIEDIELKVDYKIYPTQIENKLREEVLKEGGYVMDFPDVIKIESVLPQVGPTAVGSEQVKEFRLQLQNKEVHTITCIKKYEDGVTTGSSDSGEDTDIFFTSNGQYCIGMRKETYNLKVNGSDLFEEDLRFANSHYNQVEYTIDKRLEIERPLYYSDRNTFYSQLSRREFNGLYKPLCADLRNGTMELDPLTGKMRHKIIGGGTSIGNYPILFKYKRTPVNDYDNQKLLFNFYIVVTRKAIITNNGNKQNVVISY